MRRFWRNAPWLAVCAVILCWHASSSFADCDQVPAGQMLRVRLIEPVSSYSAKPGTPVRAILVESPQCEGLPFFRRGTLVSGRVKSVHRVGIGIRHESAAIEIQFNWISPQSGASSAISAQVVEIDDARETVKNGVIHGISPADTPQSRFFFPVPLSLAAWNPYSYWVTTVFKAAFPIAPEPEIHFPPGTDFRLKLTAPIPVAGGMETMPPVPDFSESDRQSLDELVAAAPERSFNTKGLEADVVNLVFLGSQQQIANAFRIAGWISSAPVTAHSVLQGMHAVFADTSDPTLPMAHHLLNGLPSSFHLEKSLDSYAKRDHLRIWNGMQTWEGQSVWLSASTAETGATWSFRTRKFVHEVNPEVDQVRQKIVRDLSMAGCVAAVYNSPRPAMSHVMLSTAGTELRTDGAAAVVQLTDCALPSYNESSGPAGATRPRTKIARFLRTEVLAVRDVWRDNPAYAGYEVVRATSHAIRHNRNNRSELADAALPGAPPLRPAPEPRRSLGEGGLLAGPLAAPQSPAALSAAADEDYLSAE